MTPPTNDLFKILDRSEFELWGKACKEYGYSGFYNLYCRITSEAQKCEYSFPISWVTLKEFKKKISELELYSSSRKCDKALTDSCKEIKTSLNGYLNQLVDTEAVELSKIEKEVEQQIKNLEISHDGDDKDS